MAENVLEYLSECVRKTPDKRALAIRDRAVSFRELDLQARRYGNTVTKIIQKCRCPVGVFCDRDIEPIIAFLGVLYSGNYYIPIDPNAPSEKLQSIISDADIKIMIGTDKHREILDLIGFSGLLLTPDTLSDNTETAIPEQSGLPLYMVYTSGSTGKPKGVLKSHAAEISFIEAYCDTFKFSKDDVVGNQTPFFFDAAAKDIYLMLKAGITLEIIPTELFPLPPELIRYLNEKKITVASWVPTVLSIVAQLNPFSVIRPETLKKIFFVGEVMPVKHLNKWREALPNIKYVNLYGQSELCGICCYYEVKRTFENDSVLPIGIPLKNCRIYLIGENGVITEPGQIGEIYISSDALATEYYNDPEKTKNSFIYSDFGDGKVRAFKTGDLAQYDRDGNLTYVSRTDYQIKHMGHRIELGEIETISGALPGVARCCCLYNAEKRKIVLFCELADGCSVTEKEIKSTLKTRLSSYMVPGGVTILEKLPLNANGKIDRQKLKTIL